MPESPPGPAPRRRLPSTVSAWSSAVCPVAMISSGPASASRARVAGGPQGRLGSARPGRGKEPVVDAQVGRQGPRRGDQRRASRAGRDPPWRPAPGGPSASPPRRARRCRPRRPAPPAPGPGQARRDQAWTASALPLESRPEGAVRSAVPSRPAAPREPIRVRPPAAAIAPAPGSPPEWAGARAPPRRGRGRRSRPCRSTARMKRSPWAYCCIFISRPVSLRKAAWRGSPRRALSTRTCGAG